MIQIVDKSACCGCSACISICPQKCISFNEDEQGFLYPQVRYEDCINCGLCEKVCPIINQESSNLSHKVFAAKNKDENIRMKSSSGGIFTILAESIIKRGGVVFGARFDENWEVKHDYTETIEGLSVFRGSKYVQSRVENSYIKAEEFLKNGREVLFSGTPCQIAGLKKYLRKEYANLLAVDFVCHGVPSPLVWREYLNTIIRPQGVVGKNTDLHCSKRIPVITGIDFRDKSTGWKKYGFVVRGMFADKANQNSDSLSDKSEVLVKEPFFKNIFMQGFLQNLYLRPSCYACPAKAGKSGADITLGDFWGIENHYPDFCDDKGCGLVIINSAKADDLLEKTCELQETILEKAVMGNSCILHSVNVPVNYKYFWKKWNKKKNLHKVMSEINNTNIIMRLRRFIFRIVGI